MHSVRPFLIAILLAAGGFAGAYFVFKPGVPAAPAEMVWIPAGTFTMGSADPKDGAAEKPVRQVKLDGFWMDEHEVTNDQFKTFVDATKYVTTAEKDMDWEELKKQYPPGTPKPPAEQLKAGSLVFTPTAGPVPLNNHRAWWKFVQGANWKHPEGPDSDITGRGNHPVVQVSWDDAVAYARWAGKRLPTEAEWEYACRGGLAGKRYPWGDNHPKDDDNLANIWQGNFPHANSKRDGYDRTSPVKCYPPNGFGLYDMAGNVWEWCLDWYAVDEYRRTETKGLLVNPIGPTASKDVTDPLMPKRVTRGGSFLCHLDYCESYRPAARRGTAYDTGMSHIGFRCVKEAEKAR